MTDLEYLSLSKPAKIGYDFLSFLKRIPLGIAHGTKNLVLTTGRFFKTLWNEIVDVVMTFVNGDWITRLSFLVMGFGNCMRKQPLRGILFFVFQTFFNLYMFTFGILFLCVYYVLKIVLPVYRLVA